MWTVLLFAMCLIGWLDWRRGGGRAVNRGERQPVLLSGPKTTSPAGATHNTNTMVSTWYSLSTLRCQWSPTRGFDRLRRLGIIWSHSAAYCIRCYVQQMKLVSGKYVAQSLFKLLIIENSPLVTYISVIEIHPSMRNLRNWLTYPFLMHLMFYMSLTKVVEVA